MALEVEIEKTAFDDPIQYFEKILNGELDWRLIRTLLPYAEYLETQIEAAVVAGVLPWETLDILSDHFMGGKNRRRKV